MNYIEDGSGFFMYNHFDAGYAKRTKSRTGRRIIVNYDQLMIEKYMQYIYTKGY